MDLGIESIEKVWGALVAVATAAAAVWRYRAGILRALSRMRSAMGAPGRLWARLSTALDSIEAVKGEVFKNGGSSLRDAVDRCVAGVTKMNGLFCLQTDLSGKVAFICDERGLCTYVSDGWRNMTGLTNEEASGNRWTGALHPEDRARVVISWNASVADGTVFRDRYRYRNRQTGDVHLVDVSASPVLSAAGKPVCFYGQGEIVETIHAAPDWDVDSTFPPLHHHGGRA